MKKENESDKKREEKLFHAIGNLPEDMVAQAAEYKRTKRSLADIPFWKGLAVVACAAVVLLGGIRITSVVQRQLQDDANKSKESQFAANANINDSEKKDSNSIGEDPTKDKPQVEAEVGEKDKNALDGSAEAVEGTAEIKLWAAGSMASGELGADGSKGSAKQGDRDGVKADDTSDVRIPMEEGETIALKTEEIKGIGGEKLSVITFRFGQKEDDVTYLLRSQASNCKIVTVAHDGLRKYINLPNAECVSGDTVSFDTRWFAEVDWVYNLVPEWTETDIMDVIDICEKREDGEEYKLGRIIIGRQKEGEGEKYYGVYQNKND